MKCPSCGATAADGAPECPSCGIIFAKLKEGPKLRPTPPPNPFIWWAVALAALFLWLAGFAVYYWGETEAALKRSRLRPAARRAATPAGSASPAASP